MKRIDRLLVTSATLFIASTIIYFNINPGEFHVGNVWLSELGIQVVQGLILLIMAASFLAMIKYGVFEKD